MNIQALISAIVVNVKRLVKNPLKIGVY